MRSSVCLNSINLYMRVKRAVFFDLLGFMGEGSWGERAVYMGRGKQQGNAPQWELRGLPGENLHFAMWVWAAGSIFSCERRKNWLNSQSAFVLSSQWNTSVKTAVRFWAVYGHPLMSTLTWGIKARITPVAKNFMTQQSIGTTAQPRHKKTTPGCCGLLSCF